MKQLLILLFSLLAVSGFAANPAYTDFRGTNEVLVATNPTTGRIIIGPATPISTQINAAQVWTNAAGVVFIPDAATNAMFISSNRSLLLGLGAWRQYFPSVPLSADSGVYILHQADLPEATTRSAVSVETVNSDAYSIDNFAFLATDTNSTELYLSGLNGYLDVWFNDLSLPFPFALGISNNVVLAASARNTTNATPLDVAGVISGFAGFANYSTLSTNAVTATGVTNTATIDRQAFVTATASSFTINDRSGSVLYTSPVLTATLNIRLQPGWSVRAASGLVGTVIP